MRFLHHRFYRLYAALALLSGIQFFQATAAPLSNAAKNPESREARFGSAAKAPSVVERVQQLLADEGQRRRVLQAIRQGRLAQFGEAFRFFQRFPRHQRMLEAVLSSRASADRTLLARGKAANANFAQNDALKIVASKPEGPPHGMAFYGNKSIVGAGAALIIFDLSGSEPAKVGSQRVPFTIQDLAVDGNRLYVIGGEKLQVFDLMALGKHGQGFTSLPLITQVQLLFTPMGMLALSNFVYLIDTDGVHIFNATNLESIAKAGLAAAPFAFAATRDPSAPRLFVGTWSGMKIIDITDPAAPNELGSYTAPSTVGSFFATGDRAFIGLSDRTDVLDITDPNHIQTVATIPEWGADITGFKCGDNTTVLISSRFTVQVHSSSNWTQPLNTFVPSVGLDRLILGEDPCSSPSPIGGFGRDGVQFGSFNGTAMTATGHFVTPQPIVMTIPDPVVPPFNAFGVGNWEVQQVDWSSNPEQPIVQTTTFGDVGSQNGFFGGAEVWQQGDRRIGAFGLNSAAGVTVQDITDFSNPYELARTQAGGFTNVIKECGNLMILGTDEGEIVIFDKSDPQNLVEVSRTSFPNGSIKEIEIRCPDRLYVAAGDAGFIIMDISDPKNPKILGQTTGSVWDVGITGNHACINDFQADAIRILDISDPANPRQTDSLKKDDIDGPVLDLAAGDGYMHIGVRVEKYETYRIQNGKISGPIAQQDLPGAKSIRIQKQAPGSMKVSTGTENYIYIASGDGGMYILQFNPAAANSAPEFVATLADTTVKQGETLEIDFDATDADGDSVYFVPVSVPVGATLDSQSGLFRWPITAQVNPGNYIVTVGATDGKDTTTTSISVNVVATTGIADDRVPQSFVLHSVYPNPFVDLLHLRYSSPAPGRMRVTIYDVLGRQLKAFEPLNIRPGKAESLQLSTQSLPAGLYFIRIEAEANGRMARFARKIVHLR